MQSAMTDQEKSAVYQRVGLIRCYGIGWSVVGRWRMPCVNGWPGLAQRGFVPAWK